MATDPDRCLSEPATCGLVAVLALRSARRNDPCFVDTDVLVETMARFLDDWNLHHPQIAGQWGLEPDAPIPLRGTEWLARETGLDEDEIRDIRRGHVSVVELVVFDRLAAAMNYPELIHDARVCFFHRATVPVEHVAVVVPT